MATKHPRRDPTPRVIIDRRSDRVYVKPEKEGVNGAALKSWLVGAAQQLVPLAIMAIISVTRMQSVTETQVNELKVGVSKEVGELRKQMDDSEKERRLAVTQFNAQAQEITKIGERMNAYLNTNENAVKEIRDRLQYIERNQRGPGFTPPTDRR